MDSDTSKPIATSTSSARTYILVYLGLVIVTAFELFLLSSLSPFGRGTVTPLFLLFMLIKAALVAAFYMHLRYDTRLYTFIFLVPVILLSVFAFLAVIS